MESKPKVKQRHNHRGVSVADENRPRSFVWMKEHSITDVEKLAGKCDAAVESYQELSDKTKANEVRMREIAELQRQIGTYGKTKEIYVQYKEKQFSTALPKLQLLIDIEAKRAQGKGGGYVRWAKSFNLQRMPKRYASSRNMTSAPLMSW